jgi:hypothetical protein
LGSSLLGLARHASIAVDRVRIVEDVIRVIIIIRARSADGLVMSVLLRDPEIAQIESKCRVEGIVASQLCGQ